MLFVYSGILCMLWVNEQKKKHHEIKNVRWFVTKNSSKSNVFQIIIYQRQMHIICLRNIERIKSLNESYNIHRWGTLDGFNGRHFSTYTDNEIGYTF